MFDGIRGPRKWHYFIFGLEIINLDFQIIFIFGVYVYWNYYSPLIKDYSENKYKFRLLTKLWNKSKLFYNFYWSSFQFRRVIYVWLYAINTCLYVLFLYKSTNNYFTHSMSHAFE